MRWEQSPLARFSFSDHYDISHPVQFCEARLPVSIPIFESNYQTPMLSFLLHQCYAQPFSSHHLSMVSRHLLATVGKIRRPDHPALAEGSDHCLGYRAVSQLVVD